MNLRNSIALTFVLLAATIATAQAQQGPRVQGNPATSVKAPSDIAHRISVALQAKGMLKPVAITITPVAGLFQVQIGRDLIYTDSRGNYVLQGQLFELATRANLTEMALADINRVDFEKLPLEDAIKVVRGTGRRQLVVFQDPNCGFCKHLEQEIKDVPDVTVYVFLYPILGKDSLHKANSLWCAPGRSAAWSDWMLRSAVPEAAKGDCDLTAIDRNLKLGRDIAVNGTPALIFEDGQRVAGALTAKELEAKFATVQQKR